MIKLREFMDTFPDCTFIIYDNETDEILYDERNGNLLDMGNLQILWDEDVEIKSYLVSEDIETDECFAEIWI